MKRCESTMTNWETTLQCVLEAGHLSRCVFDPDRISDSRKETLKYLDIEECEDAERWDGMS